MTNTTSIDNATVGCASTPKPKGGMRLLRHWLIYPLTGALVLGFLACPDCYLSGELDRVWTSITLSFFFWLALWNGNGYLSDLLDARISWLHEPLKRLIFGVVAMMVYTILVTLIIYNIFIIFFLGGDFFTLFSDRWFPYIKFPVIITIFIALVLHGREFLMSWRQAAINVERLKNQNLSSQFASLKNQVNPHFLFNSLNALSSLVYNDQDKAVAFIRKLSEVYRYVLDNQFEEVVDLSAELEFLKSYVFLNQMRFGEHLNVDLPDLGKLNGEYMVPPLSLQMLVENAIKHNVISKDHKLNVKVYKEDEYLVVWNNLNKKINQEKPSGVGLTNIESRYKFLTESPLFLEKMEGAFEVKIPLLKLIEG